MTKTVQLTTAEIELLLDLLGGTDYDDPDSAAYDIIVGKLTQARGG